MIPVEEAKNIIRSHVQQLEPQMVELEVAGAHMLAEDVFATANVPAFRQAAMDGYAFRIGDLDDDGLAIIGEVPAGVFNEYETLEHAAVRIFTGAPVPDNADTVVMQERVVVKNGRLFIEDPLLKHGDNVRSVGAEIRKGELGLPAGTYLSPAAIGFLAGIGHYRVHVVPKPFVTIIVTGKELQRPGLALLPGQVYESNSYTLKAALNNIGVNRVHVEHADDDVEVLTRVLEHALDRSDLVLLTGGVSVGDYDFVLRAAANCGVETLFHKVKQRPGKPLFFGKRASKVVFGLPGNPSSVLSCFYQYVTEAIQLLTGVTCVLPGEKMPLQSAYTKAAGFTHFLKGIYNNGKVRLLSAQESFRLSSFATANCLVQVGESTTNVEHGELVNVYKIY